jgi:hypothetical protein
MSELGNLAAVAGGANVALADDLVDSFLGRPELER